MRKATRLFEIIQVLRLAKKPVTAAELAETLEVTVRSIYRDIAALQAMRVPVEGERGLGYILRPGFDMPPLMFSIEETEAIVLALALLERTGDPALQVEAKRVTQKIAAAVPPPLRDVLSRKVIHAWGTIPAPPKAINLALVRQAIRDEQKIHLAYRDEAGRTSERTIRPAALVYYSEAVNIVAWCELRQAIRNFRADRVERSALAAAFFRGEGEGLRSLWVRGWASGEPTTD